jgi:hypothetical protein
MESMPEVPEGLGKVRSLFKAMLEFGGAVAEVRYLGENAGLFLAKTVTLDTP